MNVHDGLDIGHKHSYSVCLVGHVSWDVLRLAGRDDNTMLGGVVYYAGRVFERLGLDIAIITKAAKGDLTEISSGVRPTASAPSPSLSWCARGIPSYTRILVWGVMVTAWDPLPHTRREGVCPLGVGANWECNRKCNLFPSDPSHPMQRDAMLLLGQSSIKSMNHESLSGLTSPSLLVSSRS